MKIGFINLHKFTKSNLVKATAATVLCSLLMILACLIKYYIIGKPVSSGIWFCMLTLTIATFVFMGGLLMYAMVSRNYIIAHTRYFVAFLSVVAITFIAHLYLSIISPLLIAPALTALVIIQLSRRKQDAFIFNLMEAMMVLLVLLLEAIMTDGEVYMLLGGGRNAYLWYLGAMSVINVGAGAVVPVMLRDKAKRINYLIVGGIVMVASVAVYALIILVHANKLFLLQYFWLLFVSSVITVVLSLIISPVMESAFNLVTESRLAEWTNSSQPLLRKLALEAPGTYNHSLTVANFAEMCASAIGEDPYLARAAAYYHDVGKLANPSFFAENQSGYNPHDEILPEVSAEIIRNHTTDGYKLLKAYRLPEEIARVAIEHQGTLPITVFYERAKQLTDSEVNVDDYRYHGETPTTKIAGIIMICDSSEAAIRAMDKPDGERVDKLLRSIINDRITKGQFDKCKLSLHDLDIIRKTIINAFGGVFHQRVKYPEGKV
ncbi:MAG: HDIG domain-containing protein [Clostridia bacterium]|nr:HDIG domain-containing protein [Clostridia bacterium]